ncbi:PIN-like domain-containing protein [Crenobacter cavernae]|uniref:PIN-like domain-containing protein n=1 Tax=Crenobacter cavernae TaxID=2290923 RepID=UPI0011C03575|nr:PIN-like domain-containing protein [Crenobacter cavernae]
MLVITPPTKEEYKRLWDGALIVLDANVLLNLYRLPSSARKDFLSVLELLKDRFWIPHQVALEFQRNRLTVISAERKSTDEALTYASGLVNEIRKRVDGLQIDKRGLEINSDSLITELDKASGQLVAAIKAAHEQQLGISAADPIREKVDNLFSSRVGTGPASQAELDALVENGEERFKDKIPPGFMDADKDKNPNEATFIFDKIKYQRKFGDLILWRQLINHAKANNIKEIVLITADRKDDWWWREQGRTIGPHPELIREIIKDGGVELFWMYSSDQFVEHANEYLKATVSTESVAEIKHVSLSSQTETSAPNFMHYSTENTQILDRQTRMYADDRYEIRYVEECVGEWISTNIGPPEYNSRGFPDYLVNTSRGLHGYEVKYLRNFERMIVSPSVINSMLRGYMEKNEGRIYLFTLVIAISEESFFEIAESGKMSILSGRLARLLGKYPIDSILIGGVIDGKFEIFLEQSDPISEDERLF